MRSPPRGREEAAAALARLVAEHPRLMATGAAVGRAKAVLQQSATARQWQALVRQQADLMLAQPPVTDTWTVDPQLLAAAPLPPVRSSAALDTARLFGLRIQTLGITWMLSGELRYRDRAIKELLAVCAFADWAGDEFLVTAELAFGAAIGFDWLYDALGEEGRRLVEQAILDKAIQPGLDQFASPVPPPQHWMTTATNWNLVCNGALMIAALALGAGDARVTTLFAECRASVPAGFQGYRPDGGWFEGPGYWHYATQYAIYLLDSLETAGGGDLGLGRAPGFSRTGLFRLHAMGPNRRLFNFADGEEHHSGGYWLFWLGRRYHHPVDAWVEQQQAGKSPHPMDLLWFDPDQRDPRLLPRGRRFRGIEVAMLRGRWDDRAAAFLGVKAGANDAGRHTHFDLGSFVFDAQGVRWAIDLGPDDYGLPGYFDPAMKAQYYRTSTLGHNTLVVDGESQPAAAHAAFTRARLDGRVPAVTLDLAEAYPSAAAARRGFALIERRHVLVVDEIAPKESFATLDWQMHTRASVTLGERGAILAMPAPDDGAPPVRCYLHVLDPGPGTGSLSLVPATPSGPAGQDPNAGVVKLVFRLERVTAPVRIAVLLSPAPELPAALRQPLADWLPLGASRGG